MSFRPLALDAEKVRALLPHREPILLVDGVDAISTEPPGLRAHKLITATEPVLAGHFPQRAVWPGVYLIEGLAQTCALLGALQASNRGETAAPTSAAMAAANVKFLSPVVPGERLDYQVVWTFRMDALHRFDVEASVDGRLAAKGVLTLVVTSVG